MEDRQQRLATIERRCERLEGLLQSPLLLAGALVEVLREQAIGNSQLLHPAQLAGVLLGMVQAVSPN